jgi:enoyl-CoA hydratase/carnithine racemase
VLELSPGAYADLINSPFADEQIEVSEGGAVLVVSGDADPDLPRPGSLPVVVVWRGGALGAPGPPAADAVFGDADLDGVLVRIESAPRSAAALAVLMRSQPDRDVDAGLAAESAVYSVLQSGPEFATWRATRPERPAQPRVSSLLVERRRDEMTITLNRPDRRNAIDAQLRDELAAALSVGVLDTSICRVVLNGNGPSFSAGGDLDEFGTRADPATAHITRLGRSPARLIHQLGDRVEVHIHGVTLGGGIEIAAFAGTVTAAADTSIGLPELELGLIPGAGGTVSVTHRIGRQRTTALALSGARIDADTADAWGLIDRVIRPAPAQRQP